ncbi:hypothetical protein BIW11_02649 [Tropilaelaps mercedesae]|uniref:Uncharacterized protein n=1 Tax=Tropilaelaps mercedesae TaxID=418985 RepID=A0A1V9XZG9_9ACAR|nr:hypothetical protein BIW11_02649 [Tropilaelaps mercedesae]
MQDSVAAGPLDADSPAAVVRSRELLLSMLLLPIYLLRIVTEATGEPLRYEIALKVEENGFVPLLDIASLLRLAEVDRKSSRTRTLRMSLYRCVGCLEGRKLDS